MKTLVFAPKAIFRRFFSIGLPWTFFIGGAFKRKKSKMTPYKKSAPPKNWHTISKYKLILPKYGVLERFEDPLFEKK